MVTIGMDSHKASLAACAIDDAGRVLGERSFPNSRSGHRRFVAWMDEVGPRRRIGIEGAGNFGAALARALVSSGEVVLEVPSVLTARERRRVRRPGKSDPKDALAIARIVLRERTLPPVNTVQLSTDLKALVDYREQHVHERTRVANRVHADLQILCPGKHVGPLNSAVGLRRAQQVLEQSVGVRSELGLARIKRLHEIDAEIASLARRIAGAVKDVDTRLVGIPGVGSLTAAKLIAEVGDISRFATKSAFAMACGTAPIPACSGNTVRHRLNRGGNRQLNRALHVVAFVQARSHPPAVAYIQRKRGEGKSRTEALRCLKRHLANVIYTTMIAEREGRWAQALDT
jgi:transposase